MRNYFLSSVRQSMRSCARRQTIKNVTPSTTRCNVFLIQWTCRNVFFLFLTFFSSFQQCHDEYAEECKTEYSQECWDEPRQACHTESTQVMGLWKFLTVAYFVHLPGVFNRVFRSLRNWIWTGLILVWSLLPKIFRLRLATLSTTRNVGTSLSVWWSRRRSATMFRLSAY